MTDRPSTSKDDDEPPRPRTIPDDFIWDSEIQGWYPPGEPSTYDAKAEFEKMKEELSRRSPEERRKRVIKVTLPSGGLRNKSELPKRQKSLGRKKPVERDLFSDLVDDDAG